MKVSSEFGHIFLKVLDTLIKGFGLLDSELALHEVQGVEAADAVVILFKFTNEGGVLFVKLGDDLLLIWGFVGEGFQSGFGKFEIALKVFKVVLAFHGFAFEEVEFVFEAFICYKRIIIGWCILFFHAFLYFFVKNFVWNEQFFSSCVKLLKKKV